MKDFCVILIFNKKFLEKSYDTIRQIREIGLYQGKIVCIIGDDLKKHVDRVYKDDNITIKYFPEVGKTKEKNDLFGVHKPFQFHKFYCFHKYFKENYRKCFYIDVGMHIYKPMDKIINLDCTDKILAHSDAYPTYEWKLSGQFDKIIFPKLFDQLNAIYNLNVDYFQSTIMLYDTNIINDATFDILIKLSNIYINSKTNEQAILNLYFNCLLKKWEQIKIKDNETHYYDFCERFDLIKNNYIMLKYLKK